MDQTVQKFTHALLNENFSELEQFISSFEWQDESNTTLAIQLAKRAIASGSLRAVKLMVAAGMKASEEDEYGWSPVNLARNFGRREIEVFLAQSK